MEITSSFIINLIKKILLSQFYRINQNLINLILSKTVEVLGVQKSSELFL